MFELSCSQTNKQADGQAAFKTVFAAINGGSIISFCMLPVK